MNRTMVSGTTPRPDRDRRCVGQAEEVDPAHDGQGELQFRLVREGRAPR